MESECSNAAVATLLKSLPAVDALLPIFQEFRNIFLKGPLRKAAEATCTCFTIMTLYSRTVLRKTIMCSSINCVIQAALKNFAIFTRKHLCWGLFLTSFSCY